MTPLEHLLIVRGLGGMSGPQKAVLMVLASYANSYSLASQSVATLTADTCLGERTVQRALRGLEAMGRLRRVEDVGRRTWVYALDLRHGPLLRPCRCRSGTDTHAKVVRREAPAQRPTASPQHLNRGMQT